MRNFLISAFFALMLAAQTVDQLSPAGVTIDAAEYRGQKCVKVMGGSGDVNGLALVKESSFGDVVIELEVASELRQGAIAGARGFIGLAFRTSADGKTYENFYLRPTNARADDQVRRNHSVQYTSEPEFPWPKLRKEFPEMYESYTDMEMGAWIKMRIEVKGATARLFVNGNAQPSLVINDLKKGADRKGGVALWVGPGTIGYFKGLKVSQ